MTVIFGTIGSSGKKQKKLNVQQNFENNKTFLTNKSNFLLQIYINSAYF